MARGDRVPLLPTRGVVLVRASLNGQSGFDLIVDSGASQMVISRSAASRLGIDLSKPLRQQSLIGIGRSAPVPVVRLNRVRVGASEVAGVEASVYDLPPFLGAHGLLGLNFLRRFRVTFEFDTDMLILQLPPRKKP